MKKKGKKIVFGALFATVLMGIVGFIKKRGKKVVS